MTTTSNLEEALSILRSVRIKRRKSTHSILFSHWKSNIVKDTAGRYTTGSAKVSIAQTLSSHKCPTILSSFTNTDVKAWIIWWAHKIYWTWTQARVVGASSEFKNARPSVSSCMRESSTRKRRSSLRRLWSTLKTCTCTWISPMLSHLISRQPLMVQAQHRVVMVASTSSLRMSTLKMTHTAKMLTKLLKTVIRLLTLTEIAMAQMRQLYRLKRGTET